MNRRSKSVSGWVNFPVDDPEYKNTNEGGMFVKLVVIEQEGYDNGFGQCCGVSVFDQYTEILSHDDRYIDRHFAEKYHYPNLDLKPPGGLRSIDYLCVIVLGSTGWSGWDDRHGDYWFCDYEDLTEDGKELYDMVGGLYPTGKLHLLTFLDT